MPGQPYELTTGPGKEVALVASHVGQPVQIILSGLPRGAKAWSGAGPPPTFIAGASPGDLYLDSTTGDLYQLGG